MYKTLKHFDAYNYLVRGIKVSTDEFCRLISGKAHIKEIEKHKNTSYMWEYLLDYNRTRQDEIHYERWYGKGFLNAQNIIKYKLKETAI